MTRNDIRARVRSLIVERFLPGKEPGSLHDDASLERTHVIDSVRALELIVLVEEAFGITVDDEEAVPENFDTVSGIVSFVARRLSEGAEGV